VTYLVFLTYCLTAAYVIPMPTQAACERTVDAIWRGDVVQIAQAERGFQPFSAIACRAEVPQPTSCAHVTLLRYEGEDD